MDINGILGKYNYSDIASKPVSSEKSGWSKFGKVLGGIAGSLPGVGGAFGAMGVDSGMDRQLDLIRLQQAIQEQTQIINTISNVSKAKHEAAMASIRNVK